MKGIFLVPQPDGSADPCDFETTEELFRYLWPLRHRTVYRGSVRMVIQALREERRNDA
jgi:hypothetical protein